MKQACQKRRVIHTRITVSRRKNVLSERQQKVVNIDSSCKRQCVRVGITSGHSATDNPNPRTSTLAKAEAIFYSGSPALRIPSRICSRSASH